MSRRVLSRRRVKAMVTLGQRWFDVQGCVFIVRQIHRKDGLVALEGPRDERRYVPFAELGKHYRPDDL